MVYLGTGAEPMTLYRFCNLTIDSGEELPLARAAPGSEADLTLRRETDLDLDRAEPIHEWREASGEVSLRVGRCGASYVLEHPDVAIVEIDSIGDRIRYATLPGAPSDYVLSAILNQTLPRVLSLRGYLVLHASAVRVERQMVILAGSSESGKSTLAKSVAGPGSEVLSDDCVLLALDERGKVVGFFSYPGIDCERDPASRGSLRPISVKAVFELRGLPAMEQRSPEIRRLSARDATMLITRNMFVLDPSDKGRLESLFTLAGQVGSKVEAFDLLFPWGKAYLPAIGTLIVQNAVEAASPGIVIRERGK